LVRRRVYMSIERQFEGVDDPGARVKILSFMEMAELAFESRSQKILEDLSHPGGSESGKLNAADFHNVLFSNGDKVVSWIAKPFVEPKWSIFKRDMLFPPPEFWVDALIDNGKREKEYGIFFALAACEDGTLKSCYYKSRPRKKKSTTPPSDA
jgi:hypothetical protein